MVFPLLFGGAVAALIGLFAGAQLIEGLRYTFLHVIFLALGGAAAWAFFRGLTSSKSVSTNRLLLIAGIAFVLILLGIPNLLFASAGMQTYSIIEP